MKVLDSGEEVWAGARESLRTDERVVQVPRDLFRKFQSVEAVFTLVRFLF